MGWPEIEIKELTRYRFARASGYLSGLCVILSLMVFGMAVYVQVFVKKKIGLIEGMNEDLLPAFLFIVAFLGIVTGISGSKVCLANRSPRNRVFWAKYLFPFVMTELLLCVSIFTSSILCFLYIPILKKSFQKGITLAMGSYKSDKMKKIELDKLQIEYLCCGSESYKDWFPVDWVHKDYVSSPEKQTNAKTNTEHWIDDVPFSCCDPEILRPCIHHHIHNNGFHYNYDFRTKMTIYSRGCVEVLMNYYGRELLTNIGVLILSISFVQLTVLILARLLQTSIKSSLENEDLEEPSIGYIIPYHRHSKEQDTGKYPSPSKKPLLEKTDAGDEEEMDTDEMSVYSSFDSASDASSQDYAKPVKTNEHSPYKYDAHRPERNKNSPYHTIHESEHVRENEITMPAHTPTQLENEEFGEYDMVPGQVDAYGNRFTMPVHTPTQLENEEFPEYDMVPGQVDAYSNRFTMPAHTPTQLENEEFGEYDMVPGPVDVYGNKFTMPVHTPTQLENKESGEYDSIPEPVHAYGNRFTMPIHTPHHLGNEQSGEYDTILEPDVYGKRGTMPIHTPHQLGNEQSGEYETIPEPDVYGKRFTTPIHTGENDPLYDEVCEPKHNELPNQYDRNVENEIGSQDDNVLKPAHVYVNEVRSPNHASRTSKTEKRIFLKPSHVYVSELSMPLKQFNRPVANENAHCHVQAQSDTIRLVANDNPSRYGAVLKRGHARVND